MGKLLVLIAASAIIASACGSTSVEPTPTPSATPSATTSPAPSATVAPKTLDHDVVYFARDRLPPVAGHVDAAGQGTTTESRILSRLSALYGAVAPSPLFNVAANTKARPKSVKVAGDLATVDFTVPNGDWGTAGSAGTRSFIQQLVYTATEEPGIRRVLILQNGGGAIIGGEGVVIDHPAARDDVLGYSFKASLDPMTFRYDRTAAYGVSAKLSLEDATSALTRVRIAAANATPKDAIGFTARMVQNDETIAPELGKWALVVDLPNATTADAMGLEIVDRTPVRAMRTTAQAGGLRYEIGFDDLRPWRAFLDQQQLALVIDVGGDPLATSPNIALYAPVFGTSVKSGAAISGLVRAFEAQYEYKIADAKGNVIHDFAQASLGTSEFWGSFAMPLPNVAPGSATIEIMLRSPKDGEITETVMTSIQVGP
ncbi:MAG TPA: Gmad2 immunoglobulin-like domain-containing protein [Candidatus Limnocylindria bacterium]